MIKLAVCDDHDLVRAGLIQMLKADGRFAIASQASSMAELSCELRRGAPVDVLLLDLILGLSCLADGVDNVKALHVEHPHLPIVVLSMHDEPDVVHAVLSAGAKGYVTKDSAPSVMLDAVIQVHQGHRYVAPKLVESLFLLGQTGRHQVWHAELTPREYEVLKRVVAGESIKSIALDLNLSIKTVSTHKVRLMEKLGVANSADLIRLAMKHGMS